MASASGHFGLGITTANTDWDVRSGLEQRGAVSPSGFFRTAWIVCLLLFSAGSFAAEVSPPAVVASSEDTNAQQVLQAILRLEEQVHSNQLALERNNLEVKFSANRSAEALSNGLLLVEKALGIQQEAFSAQSARQLETMQGWNRALLIVGGSFAAITAVAMLMVAFFQWRMSRIWSVIWAASPMVPALGRAASQPVLEAGDARMARLGAVEDSNARLLGALGRLEKRVQELQASSGGFGQPAIEPGSRVRLLLRRGQAMMRENRLEAALSCFDEVLLLEPNQAEALVNKGATLERLHKLNEASECYDRAIAVDGSMSMAHLHKGGLCARMERYKEALESYEKALQTHDEEHR